MRNQLYLLVFHLLLVLEGYSQNHNGMLDQVGEWAEKFTVPITMIDGARLMPDVYLPAGNELTSLVEVPKIMICPNPASDLLFIDSGNTHIAFEIYNISGRNIRTGILDSFQTIDVESWDPGMYIIRFASQGPVIQQAQKIIIH